MEPISLASGATYFHTPEPASQAAIAAIQNHKTFYGEVAGTSVLREAIAGRYRHHNQAPVDPENILVTPGTKQALYNVLRAILRPGDEVLVPAPNWFGLHQVLETLDARLVLVPTVLSDNFALRPEKLRELMSARTRLFLFSNPCNPTGRRYSLEELQSWKLVRVSHVLGDRRDHFQALQDVWEIFRVILEERKRREIDPTLTVLRECAIEGEEDAGLDAATLARMQVVLEFLEMLSASFQDYQHLPPQTLQRFLKMGGKVARFLGPTSQEQP